MYLMNLKPGQSAAIELADEDGAPFLAEVMVIEQNHDGAVRLGLRFPRDVKIRRMDDVRRELMANMQKRGRP